MRLGLGLSLSNVPGGASVFNPATLSLTGWWRASFSASPWSGTASAGGSGSRDLTEATNPPAAGSAVNGLTPADFDGTNDKLTAPGTMDTYWNAGAGSGWVLAYVDAISTDNALVYLNDCILSTSPAMYLGVYLRSSGVVGIRFVDVGEVVVSTSISTGAWVLVQWKYDGSTIKIRTNGNAWTSAAAGNIGLLSQSIVLGQNYDGSEKLDGKILDVGLADTALSDANFDNVLAYCRDRYGLALA
jgi:hypothetical protein